MTTPEPGTLAIAPVTDPDATLDDLFPATHDANGDAVNQGLPNGWRGPICDLDVPTSDGRMAATPPGGIKTRAYPLTLTLNHVGDPTGYPTIGSVDRVWMQDGVAMGEGKLDINGADGAEYARQLMEGMTNRVSIDPVEVQVEWRMLGPDGNYFSEPVGGWTEEAVMALPEGTRPIMTFADWVLAGLAAVPIPAYSQAAISPVWDYEPCSALPDDAIVASIQPIESNLVQIDRIFADLREKSPWIAKMAQNAENGQNGPESAESGEIRPKNALVAALPVGGQVFTREFFEYPKLDGPTPMTVTENGRIYGHVRLNGTCFQYGGGAGKGPRCIEPPASACNYGKFRVHGAKMEDGSILAVGALTFGDGHVSRGSLEASRAHYDNVSTVAAKVVAGRDQWGDWISGEVVDEYRAKAYDLLLSPLSGHWEPDADNNNYLEMLAAHIVVTPGYSVPRIVASFDADENVTSIILTEDFTQVVVNPGDAIVASTRAEVARALADIRRAEELSKKLGIDEHLEAKETARLQRIEDLKAQLAP